MNQNSNPLLGSSQASSLYQAILSARHASGSSSREIYVWAEHSPEGATFWWGDTPMVEEVLAVTTFGWFKCGAWWDGM